MNNGEAYAIFKQIESDKYTDSDKLEAINRVLGAETHNGITKDDLINAFKWFHGVMECYLSEKDMSDRQMQEICSEIDKYSGSGLTPERCAELAQAEREGRLVVLPCKVGDTVYHRSGQHTIDDIQLFYPRQNGHVPEERIGKLQIRLGSLNYAGLQTFATYADEIGKTVFLTREEAEAALQRKERRNERD